MHRDNPRVTKGASPPFSSLLEDRPFVLINEEAFEKKLFFALSRWHGMCRARKKKNNNLCFVVLIEKSKNTTLSGGSLGSRVDEERSQLRDLV